MNRREFILSAAGSIASPIFVAGEKPVPIIHESVFLTKPTHLGWYLDQSGQLEPEYSYFQRQSLVFLKKEYAGWFSPSNRNPRTWGEMIVTERHLPNRIEKTCPLSCMCRGLPNPPAQIIHINAKWTENTKFLPVTFYDWRDDPDFQYRHPCCLCGSMETFIFTHNDKYFPQTGFYCSGCNNKIVEPIFRRLT
jgi:hypothetical protein